jgi:hypothetical protein
MCEIVVIVLGGVFYLNEINYLYTKTQQLNQRICHLHLLLANSWNSMWEKSYQKYILSHAILSAFKNVPKVLT